MLAFFQCYLKGSDRFLHYLVLLQYAYLEPEEKSLKWAHMELSHLLEYRTLKDKKT